MQRQRTVSTSSTKGVRDEAGAPVSRLWDVVIDATGKLVAEHALGPTFDPSFMTRVFVSPSGSLHVFQLYGTKSAPEEWVLGRRIFTMILVQISASFDRAWNVAGE